MPPNYKKLEGAVHTFPAKNRPAIRSLFFHMIASGGTIKSSEFDSVTRLSRAQKRLIIERLQEQALVKISKTAKKTATLSFTGAAGYKEKQPIKQPINSDESGKVLALWEAARGENRGRLADVYRSTFEKMHVLDNLSWKDIAEVVKYAALHWEKYLQSPTGLRTRSKKYPEKWTWEVARDQMRKNGHSDRFVSKRPKLKEIE